MNIAILGYGTVGSGVKEIIDHAVTKSTKQLHVSYILIRKGKAKTLPYICLLYTSPSPRDCSSSRMPSSA